MLNDKYRDLIAPSEEFFAEYEHSSIETTAPSYLLLTWMTLHVCEYGGETQHRYFIPSISSLGHVQYPDGVSVGIDSNSPPKNHHSSF